MAKAVKPTLKQSKAIIEAKKAIASGKGLNMREIMLKADYTPASAKNPELNLTSKKAWQEAMAEIDWHKQIKQVEDLGDTEINSDKDNALKAKDMLFKLGDKYPKGETKIIGIFNKIEQISE
jgi:hypothetical protein